MSDDPRFAGSSNTPSPVTCEFCGAKRYTDGIAVNGLGVLWYWEANPCTCAEGKAWYENEQVERKAQAEARKQAETDKIMRARIQHVISKSGMGERFLRRTFQTFIADTPARRKAVKTAQAYAYDFEQKTPKPGQPLPERNGILLTGDIGTGKTHIAAAIANDLLNRGTAVICMTERELLGEIKRTYSRNSGGESAVLEVYETVPLLILDDIGKEKPSEWTLATLYAIIDGRYERAMPLIITTNYDAKSLVERLTPAGADRITASAIVDRLVEMCESIVMTGESWRGRRAS